MLRLVDQLLILYSWIILARVIMTWVSRDPANPINQFLRVPTEPVLAPLRRIVPPEKLSGLDISPILAYVGVQLLRWLLAMSAI